MRIESAGEEYTTGGYHIVLQKNKDRIEDLEFDLKVYERQKVKFMFLEKQLSKEDVKEEVIESQTKLVNDIVKQSYPNKDSNWVESINTRYGQELLLELYFIWGFRDREAFDALKEAQKAELKNIREGKKEEKKSV